MFTTNTCAPCKQMKETMKEIDHTNIHLEYLDARAETEQVLKYGLRTVPSLVMLDGDGDLIKQHSGVMSAVDYLEWME